MPLCYFFEKNRFLKCYIFNESHQILVTRVLFSDLLRTVRESVNGKTLCSVYCWNLAKFTEKIGLSTSNSVIQIHSFCLVRYYAGLALIVLNLMIGEADGQVFFLPKTIGFDFLLFNYMLLSA